MCWWDVKEYVGGTFNIWKMFSEATFHSCLLHLVGKNYIFQITTDGYSTATGHTASLDCSDFSLSVIIHVHMCRNDY